MTSAVRGFTQPQWTGDMPLAGRTILLHAEQGFGDTLQFCRYAPLLAEAGARVLLEAPPALCRLLGSLAGVARVIPAGDDLPPFDHAMLVSGLEVMPEWFLERHLGHTPGCGEWDVLEAAFDMIVRNALAQPRRFVHRDFHSRNLLVTDARNPGVIDFQGALHGPVTYDLASLLRDAYIAWPRERVEGWVESYRLRLRRAGVIGEEVDAPRFLRWFDLTGLHRHVRVLGQFYRLWYRDGKPSYLKDVPQVYRYVTEVAASYPELADFAALLERHAAGRDLTQVAA